jgi:3-oxoacyl-[acyl-carrier-protein] synthase II
MKRRVVITGLGIVSALGSKLDECWRRLVAAESGIRPLTLFNTSDLKVTFGGEVSGFDPTGYIEHKDLNRVDRFAQYALVAAADAVRDSGIDFSGDTRRYGVVLGSGIGGLETCEEQVVKLNTKGPSRVSPMTIPRLMLNAGGGNIAIMHGLRGPNYSIATACASATNAMGNAFEHVRTGLCDLVITGGAEAAITRIGMSAFSNMRALSTRNDEPHRASRPFDKDRDGFVFADGAGLLIFEELEHARKRGARIYCEVVGFGTTCDAGHITQPDEHGTGAGGAMQGALVDAQVSPEKVDYINAHGTSTPLGDIAETKAIKAVFGPAARKVSISSTKSQVGHSLGASGGIELVVTVMAIQDNLIPPTINLDNPDPECDLDYTPNQARERVVNYAMSNSFGFGGHNASILVKRFEG